MKLATVTPDGTVHCLVCSWNWKCPKQRRTLWQDQKDLGPQDRLKLLEENILSHLKYQHDRLMLTKEEEPVTEEGLVNKVHYFGRRPGLREY